jgi:GGDEF domain-containing protein
LTKIVYYKRAAKNRKDKMYLTNRNYNELTSAVLENFDKTHIFSITLLDIDNFHQRTSIENRDETILNFTNFFRRFQGICIYYLGKDEFAIIGLGKSAELTFNEIKEVKNNFFNEFNFTFSAGVAEVYKHGNDCIELLRNLEDAVYKAKTAGKDKVLIVDTKKMVLKSNYYTINQLRRLIFISKKLSRSEASILREALDIVIRKYEK